jgi:hypothetical protein
VTSFDLPTALAGPVTLEVSDLGVEDPLHAIGVEVPLGVAWGMSFNPPLGLKSALDIGSTSVPLFDGTLAPPALGLYLAKFLFFLIFCSVYGLLAGPISSILILMLTMPFVDSSP